MIRKTLTHTASKTLFTLLVAGLAVLLALPLVAQDGAAAGEAAESMAAGPKVKLETNHGAMVIELYPDKAPKTVENFLAYVDAGFYDGTLFHRVIPGFMIQGGGYDAEMNKKPTRDPVVNESQQSISNARGTIAMARTNDPHSATAQFFVNVVDNDRLDNLGGGYTAFGQVVEGMDVADAIAALPTQRQGRMSDVPTNPVMIKKATRVAGE